MKQYIVLHLYYVNGRECIAIHQVDTALDMTKQETIDKLIEDMGIDMHEDDHICCHELHDQPYILD